MSLPSLSAHSVVSPMRPSVVAGLAMLASTVAAAQEVPKRPPLAADADTNDAASYVAWGVTHLDSFPAQAADAFYWAARIDPSSGEALYARWVAAQLVVPKKINDHVAREAAAMRSADVRRTDSIEWRALMRDPLVFRALDGALIPHVEGGEIARVAYVAPSEHCTRGSGMTPVGPQGNARPGSLSFYTMPGAMCTQTNNIP